MYPILGLARMAILPILKAQLVLDRCTRLRLQGRHRKGEVGWTVLSWDTLRLPKMVSLPVKNAYSALSSFLTMRMKFLSVILMTRMGGCRPGAPGPRTRLPCPLLRSHDQTRFSISNTCVAPLGGNGRGSRSVHWYGNETLMMRVHARRQQAPH